MMYESFMYSLTKGYWFFNFLFVLSFTGLDVRTLLALSISFLDNHNFISFVYVNFYRVRCRNECFSENWLCSPNLSNQSVSVVLGVLVLFLGVHRVCSNVFCLISSIDNLCLLSLFFPLLFLLKICQ